MKFSNAATLLRKHNLTVVETAGWKNRGYAGQDMAEIRGQIAHHTATGRNAFLYSNAPTLNLCINGRSDLPGPLCQGVVGRDGTIYLTGAGLCNHAGVGRAAGIPDNTGNYYLIGWEFESSGVAPWDWTEDQLRVAPYLFAATEIEFLGHLPEDMRLLLGHKEYSTEGKIDPAGWPGDMAGMRAQANRAIAELQRTKKPAAAKAKPVKKPAPAKKSTRMEPAGGLTWTVERGDTLSEIARHYYIAGTAKQVKRIKDHNGIKDARSIKPGQVIKIPAGLYYPVKGGETIQDVANRYGVHTDWLFKLNSDLKGKRPTDKFDGADRVVTITVA